MTYYLAKLYGDKKNDGWIILLIFLDGTCDMCQVELMLQRNHQGRSPLFHH